MSVRYEAAPTALVFAQFAKLQPFDSSQPLRSSTIQTTPLCIFWEATAIKTLVLADGLGTALVVASVWRLQEQIGETDRKALAHDSAAICVEQHLSTDSTAIFSLWVLSSHLRLKLELIVRSNVLLALRGLTIGLWTTIRASQRARRFCS
jgi:hypothetical protein